MSSLIGCITWGVIAPDGTATPRFLGVRVTPPDNEERTLITSVVPVKKSRWCDRRFIIIYWGIFQRLWRHQCQKITPVGRCMNIPCVIFNITPFNRFILKITHGLIPILGWSNIVNQTNWIMETGFMLRWSLFDGYDTNDTTGFNNRENSITSRN